MSGNADRSHHCPQTCETVELIALLSAAYEKGSIPAVFLQLLAGRLVHSASSPSHNGKGTSWIGHLALVRERKMTSLLPCFQTRMGSPCCAFPHTSQAHNPRSVAWMASGAQWQFRVDQLFPELPAGQSVPLQTSKQLLTRGDASPTSVGKSLCLIPDCLPPLVFSLQIGTFPPVG